MTGIRPWNLNPNAGWRARQWRTDGNYWPPFCINHIPLPLMNVLGAVWFRENTLFPLFFVILSFVLHQAFDRRETEAFMFRVINSSLQWSFDSWCIRHYYTSISMCKDFLWRNLAIFRPSFFQPRSPPTTPKTLEDKKSRSIEEREHDYEKARARIFKDVSWMGEIFVFWGCLVRFVNEKRYATASHWTWQQSCCEMVIS